ncbi:MAG: nucleoside hydrolase [Gemmatimonas sp. SG8_17]|nr:MAG: nucleoside hydrolase [Gemmatimonas sp. SG8_17]
MSTCSVLFMLILGSVVISACSTDSALPAADKIRILLDTDANNELDDQHAIAYMLLNGGVFEVEGLTVNRTSSGGGIDEHAKEAQRIVTLCTLFPELDVHKGASGSFEDIQDHLDTPDFDGVDAVQRIIDRANIESDRKLVLVPVGKLTNIALALKKDPGIAERVRIVWLGSNYPEPGEYNQINDEPALSYILDTDVDFEIALVRYGEPSGTDAVKVTLEEIGQNMPGRGPSTESPVTGRHGGTFTNFGDYSVSLFEHIDLYGDPPSRALFDMAAVAIVKNPDWATSRSIPAPLLQNGEWTERPNNERAITLWENFDRAAIIADFFATMNNYTLTEIAH